MVFSTTPLRHFQPFGGHAYQGVALTKSEEYRALQAADIPVPRWACLTPSHEPDLELFGPYVVIKPDRGGRGADVKIMQKGRVRWRPPTADFVANNTNWIIQEFIHTGPWPVSFRVATLFGTAL